MFTIADAVKINQKYREEPIEIYPIIKVYLSEPEYWDSVAVYIGPDEQVQKYQPPIKFGTAIRSVLLDIDSTLRYGEQRIRTEEPLRGEPA